MLSISKKIKDFRITFILLGAIILGSIFGLLFTNSIKIVGDYLDMTILALIFFLFLEVPFEKFSQTKKKIKFISIAWLSNFILIPIIGFSIAYIFLNQQPAILLGLLIYFSFPCTDWFLAFTRISKGDTATGSVLLPINMMTQILIYPIYLILFANLYVELPYDNLLNTLEDWFFKPFLIALVLNIAIRKFSSEKVYKKIQVSYSYIIESLLVILIFIIFATNITTIAENIYWSFIILIAVFLFFLIVYLVTEKISNLLNFKYELKVLYTMTTSARNAPLMLAITTIAVPNQPLVYMAIIIGMLIEFPHLTALTKIFSNKMVKEENTDERVALEKY